MLRKIAEKNTSVYYNYMKYKINMKEKVFEKIHSVMLR